MHHFSQRVLRSLQSKKREETLKDSNDEATPKLNIDTTTDTIAHRVTGVVSCRLDHNEKPVSTNQPMAAKVIVFFWLNMVLAFALAVCVCALLLTHATTQLMNSFAITLVTAVIAIVTSCFLSIGKRLIAKHHIFNKYIFPKINRIYDDIDRMSDQIGGPKNYRNEQQQGDGHVENDLHGGSVPCVGGEHPSPNYCGHQEKVCTKDGKQTGPTSWPLEFRVKAEQFSGALLGCFFAGCMFGFVLTFLAFHK